MKAFTSAPRTTSERNVGSESSRASLASVLREDKRAQALAFGS
jgi:hypothetical protein